MFSDHQKAANLGVRSGDIVQATVSIHGSNLMEMCTSSKQMK